MATQEEKISSIQHVLKSEYNSTRWKAFLSELFTSSNFYSNPTALPGINDAVASQALHIGNITLNDNGISRGIAVYEVMLAENVVLERNRVGLRNLLKPHWKQQDAAFIVYYHPQNKSWRFSYVSELRIFTENGYVPNNTEPKRYTYVLGEYESCRTAAIQFSKLQEKVSNATLDDVKEAFSVEKMSDDFFREYKEHYQDFVQFLTGKRLEKVSGKWEEVVKHAPNTQLISIFNNNEKDVRDFCKKLLGRIVFLYFIQKKGWLGVPVTDDWGKGNYNYLSDLFKNCRNPAIFYSEYLSKLFFDTLNQQRPNDAIEIIPGEPCRIPYLNGGLFEEDDQNHRNLVLEAKLFKDLFAFFDQYNFTIYEDDPNDHTVAVDPEMLGHIFENLLEDNKDKGAYYTPKEIVHYMCQESLIEYLTTWFEGQGYSVQQDSFISFDNPAQASFISANDGRTGQGVLEISQTPQQPAKLINRSIIEKLLKKQLSDDDKQAIIEHADNFNKALDAVKICDPAIGSGAFPMGLLQEIFTAKQTIHTFEHGDLSSFEPAKVKLNIIQNSIYGVDIERGAVDIARLRFWLSLVVDEPAPQALPNLDYKIVVGNSLVSKLGDDVIEIDWDVKKNTTFDIFGEQETKSIQNILKQITSLQKEFFNPNARKKDQATKIRDLKIDLLIEQLNLMISSKGVITKPVGNSKAIVAQTERFMQTEGWKQQIKKLQQLKTQQDKPLEFFDWQLNFAEVMNKEVASKVGFDIVIANPPYLDYRKIESSVTSSLSYPINKSSSRPNLYQYFIELGDLLLASKGSLIFINPNQFLSTDNGYYLRKFLIENREIKFFVDVSYVNIFVEASTYTTIWHYKKTSSANTTIRINRCYELNRLNHTSFEILQNSLLLSNKKIIPLNQEFFHLEKIESGKSTLGTIATLKWGTSASGYGQKKITKNSYDKLSSTEQKLYSPILQTADTKKYWIDWQAEYIPIEIYSDSIKKEFQKQKIVVGRLTKNIQACLDENKHFVGKSTIIFDSKLDLKILLAILNSSFANRWYFLKFETTHMAGGYIRYDIPYIEQLPIPVMTEVNKLNVIHKVNQILELTGKNLNSSHLQKEIDNMVYKLYNLTLDEVKLIDPDFALSEAEYDAISVT